MKPEQYHQVLIGIDRALFVIHENPADFSSGDLDLAYELELIRSKVLKAESGHPFPFQTADDSKSLVGDEITRAPWSRSR